MMNDYWTTLLHDLPLGIGFVALGFIVLIIAKITKDYVTPYNDDEHLTEKDNPALGLSRMGYYLGVITVFLGTLHEPEDLDLEYTFGDYWNDLLVVFLYSLAGIALLNVSRFLMDKLILRRFCMKKEILEDRNSGTGAVQCGNYITSGLIIAGAFHGEGDILSAAVFFALGQAALIVFVGFYQLITRYDIHAQIEKDNVAAGVALGGNMVAIGVILLKGLSGNFVSWSDNILGFGVYAVVGCILLFVVRWTADVFMLPNATFDKEIAEDRNLAAAFIECAVVIGAAVIVLVAL